MAERGRRTTRVDLGASREDRVVKFPEQTQGLKPPGKLTKAEQALWDRYVATASWLTPHDELNAHLWCVLVAKFLKAPRAATNSEIREMRAVGNELGLGDIRRRKGDKPPKTPAQAPEADAGEEFFD